MYGSGCVHGDILEDVLDELARGIVLLLQQPAITFT